MQPETTLTVNREPAAADPPPFWHSTPLLIALGAVLVAGVLALGVVGASALFTKAASSTSNMFTSGSVNLSVTPGTAIVSMSSMMAGDSATGPVTVTNTGTGALRYTIKSTTTENTLAGQLTLTVKSGVATCDTANFAASGAVLYGPAALGSATGINVVGDPAAGSQAGDRPLAAGASEVLCMQVTLPLSTDSTYQNRTTTATFDFSAEQTMNNP